MDLESDVEVAERERNGLLEIRHRLEGHLRRAGHAADEAESRVDAAIGPIRKQLPELATQAELAALRSEVYRLDSRLDSFEDRGEVQQPVDRRLAEVERAAITLSRRLARLRREVDAIVEAFAQAG